MRIIFDIYWEIFGRFFIKSFGWLYDPWSLLITASPLICLIRQLVAVVGRWVLFADVSCCNSLNNSRLRCSETSQCSSDIELQNLVRRVLAPRSPTSSVTSVSSQCEKRSWQRIFRWLLMHYNHLWQCFAELLVMSQSARWGPWQSGLRSSLSGSCDALFVFEIVVLQQHQASCRTEESWPDCISEVELGFVSCCQWTLLTCLHLCDETHESTDCPLTREPFETLLTCKSPLPSC